MKDLNRTDQYSENEGDFRQISLRIWYPAEPDWGSQPMPYYRQEVAENLIGMGLFYDNFLYDIALQASCSFKDAPMVKTEDPFPLVIYSSSDMVDANIFLFEYLASHGYVVISVGHPHWCLFYYDEQGKPYFPDYETDTHYKDMWEEEGSAAVEQLKERLTVAPTVDEKRVLLEELNNKMPVEIGDLKQWVRDFDFVIAELARLNAKGKLFDGALDLDKICIMGYSKGGVAAAHACMAEKRCMAGINLSGFMFGDIQDKPIQVPFMDIESEESWCENCDPINDIIYHNTGSDIYMIQIKGATHGNFTDLSAYKSYITSDFEGLLGTIDGLRFLEIQNDCILKFLDYYVKELPSAFPAALSGEYKEVLFKTNVNTRQVVR